MKLLRMKKLFTMLLVLSLVLSLSAIQVTALNIVTELPEIVCNTEEHEESVYYLCIVHGTQLVTDGTYYIDESGYLFKYTCPSQGCGYYVWVHG